MADSKANAYVWQKGCFENIFRCAVQVGRTPRGIYIYIYMCLHIYNVLRRDLGGGVIVFQLGKKLSFESQNLPCIKRQLWLCNSARLGLGQKGAIFVIYTHIYILLARKQYI